MRYLLVHQLQSGQHLAAPGPGRHNSGDLESGRKLESYRAMSQKPMFVYFFLVFKNTKQARTEFS
jgi:hypothetical protein